MDFELNYSELIEVIKDEIAREASQAYTSEGESLYESLRWVSRDDERSQRMMGEVLSGIKEQCNRFICCADFEADTTTDMYGTLTFDLVATQRRIAGREGSVSVLLRSLVTDMFLQKYFLGKNNTDLASKYNEMAVADIKSLSNLLYTKMPPTYPV